KRIVTNTYFTHKSAEFRTYYWDKETPNKVEEFEQDKNFMLDFEQFGDNIHQRPTVGQSMGWKEYNFPSIDQEFLENNFTKTNALQLINKAAPKIPNAKVSFIDKIKKALFS